MINDEHEPTTFALFDYSGRSGSWNDAVINEAAALRERLRKAQAEADALRRERDQARADVSAMRESCLSLVKRMASKEDGKADRASLWSLIGLYRDRARMLREVAEEMRSLPAPVYPGSDAAAVGGLP